MRYLLLLLSLSATVSLYSCGKCTCKDPVLKGIKFGNIDTASEQTANIEVYNRSTLGFSSLASSFANQPIVQSGTYGTLVFDFDYTHDYIITINPSGKVLKIKNIGHGNYTKQNMGFKASCETCLNSVTYTVNDSVVSQPEVVTPIVETDFYMGIAQ